MLAFLKQAPKQSIADLLKADFRFSVNDARDNADLLTEKLKSSGFQRVIAVRSYHLEKDLQLLLDATNLESFGDRYLLIEADYDGLLSKMDDIVFLLEIKGFRPVLAHAERYDLLRNNYKKVLKLHSRGCLLAIDLISLTGHHGLQAKRLAEKLLRENLVGLVLSGVNSLIEHEKFNSLLQSKWLHKCLLSTRIRNKQLA